MIPTTQETLSQARRWVRVPWDAGPWDVEIARLCITQTEQRVDATLGHRSSAWWATVDRIIGRRIGRGWWPITR